MPLLDPRELIGRRRDLRSRSDPPSIDWPRTIVPAADLRSHLGTQASKRSATVRLVTPTRVHPPIAPADRRNMARWRCTLLDNVVSLKWHQILEFELEAGAGPWLENSSLVGFAVAGKRIP